MECFYMYSAPPLAYFTQMFFPTIAFIGVSHIKLTAKMKSHPDGWHTASRKKNCQQCKNTNCTKIIFFIFVGISMFVVISFICVNFFWLCTVCVFGWLVPALAGWLQPNTHIPNRWNFMWEFRKAYIYSVWSWWFMAKYLRKMFLAFVVDVACCYILFSYFCLNSFS